MGCGCGKHKDSNLGPSIPLMVNEDRLVGGDRLVGIQPEWLWREIRVKELIQTIERYVEAKTFPRPEWFTELATHVEILKTQGILK